MNRFRNISQVEQECGQWKRSLNFLLQENAFLKTRLAEIISDLKPGERFLGDAEQFLQAFIRNDEVISFLRNDITAFRQLLTRYPAINEPLQPEVSNLQKTLRRDVNAIETAFTDLKYQFNNYLSDVA